MAPSLTIGVQTRSQRRSGTAFALIGADGVHSSTRTNLLAGPPAIYTGRTAWRALVPIPALRSYLDSEHTSVLLGPDFHLVAYPLHHRGQFNLALFVDTPIADVQSRRAPTLSGKSEPSARLSGIMTAVAKQWGAWPLYTVEAPSWFNGNIGLVGDAAHAMEPFQAQGAAMAVEDAAVLAPLLVGEPDAASAFSKYQATRQPRVQRVMRTSHSNGQIFHMHWPWTIGRDQVMRIQGPRGHFRRLDWLYAHAAATMVQEK
ncbi:FAD-dependent monooxygenase [Devosia algicola]|uniref:FAD-dependent monooxygenase n=1 Tax=Devosia algicola TaxID=3026418 RepID=A0ABY7YR83_9HYPH|nr:FAD-dependent monooxygenase [Devosia algicola]WDR03692.1 FAD-dependent monooxygenase [Devosia algicola]